MQPDYNEIFTEGFLDLNQGWDQKIELRFTMNIPFIFSCQDKGCALAMELAASNFKVIHDLYCEEYLFHQPVFSYFPEKDEFTIKIMMKVKDES